MPWGFSPNFNAPSIRTEPSRAHFDMNAHPFHSKLRRAQALLAVAALLLLSGFDFSRHSIPLDEILSGGPEKDGIPAIMQPKFLSAKEAGRELKDADRVLGVVRNGVAKAYPIKILNWHEIVNDRIGKQAVVVTFCPLCGTGMVFDGTVAGKPMTFGVSGLLYQSDMLLYDHRTESLWSQIKQEAVTGELTGTRLRLLSSTHTTWKQWRNRHPDTLVLSRDTGHRRDYDRDPYMGYYKSAGLMFGVRKVNRAYHPKEKVIGIRLGDAVKAYPFSELAKTTGTVQDDLDGVAVRVIYDKTSKTAQILNEKGEPLPSVVGFWFAWYAFHPGTEIFTEKGK